MCQFIPGAERLVTIEDVRELMLPHHPNRVHLLYTKGRADQMTVTPAELIASCMRMAPSRVLLAELRGSEAWDFLKLLTTGHAGFDHLLARGELCAVVRALHVHGQGKPRSGEPEPARS